jgi:hypothetical protein
MNDLLGVLGAADGFLFSFGRLHACVEPIGAILPTRPNGRRDTMAT